MNKVLITTAVELNSAQLSRLKKAVEKKYGSTVEYQETVDSSILGGLILTINSRQLDGSLRSKLYQIKQRILQEIRQ